MRDEFVVPVLAVHLRQSIQRGKDAVLIDLIALCRRAEITVPEAPDPSPIDLLAQIQKLLIVFGNRPAVLLKQRLIVDIAVEAQRPRD